MYLFGVLFINNLYENPESFKHPRIIAVVIAYTCLASSSSSSPFSSYPPISTILKTSLGVDWWDCGGGMKSIQLPAIRIGSSKAPTLIPARSMLRISGSSG